ncbi:hypothetical protein CO151_00680 [bacterium CG_4_9_14_3_um_filter_65_15]|nr:MAG: hypothetical protein CO151_00680 [bacterium CG_4_9_14_3_um_filter_65_15]
MKTMFKGLLIVLVLAALPMGAAAQQLFDFTGQALIPGSVGGTLDMYGEIFDPVPATTPIPLDFANYQYTVVVNAVMAATGIVRTYSGGTIAIYEDAGTAADYTNPATLSDGTAILLGTFSSFSQFVPPIGPGSASGTVDWVGGSRLNDIAPEDQAGWAFLSGTNPNSGLLEPGYDEVWDGKVEPTTTIVDTENASMSKVKALFK